MSIMISQFENEFRLHAELKLPRPLDEVFPFFASAKNLEALTPPLLHFKITSLDAIEMCKDTIINYRLRIHGIPIRWTSLINLWDPPHRFIDEQIRGPYRYWIHQHLFEKCGNETIVKDDVRYQVFGGRIVHDLLVKRDLMKIFSFRQTKLKERFS